MCKDQTDEPRNVSMDMYLFVCNIFRFWKYVNLMSFHINYADNTTTTKGTITCVNDSDLHNDLTYYKEGRDQSSIRVPLLQKSPSFMKSSKQQNFTKSYCVVKQLAY